MDDERRRRALALWERAQQHHLRGALDRAIELYDESIAVMPTAEAYTFRGWAYSIKGRIRDAIDECHKAIETDPTFGNPYNDIGSYLMKLGDLDEAVPWLEKAKTAERYEPKHFPYMNLARLFARKGQLARAIAELDGALELCPGEPTCLAMKRELSGMLN
jgi:tetratricopeptide (TPR) repeat protein